MVHRLERLKNQPSSFRVERRTAMGHQDMQNPVLPWWRVPTMWLVIAGPALVVAAGIATLVIALKGGDTPVRDAAQRQAAVPKASTMMPAAQARNHAATPSP
jgi:hypothetical protein